LISTLSCIIVTVVGAAMRAPPPNKQSTSAIVMIRRIVNLLRLIIRIARQTGDDTYLTAEIRA
jgi:hypothetical protein